MSAGAGTTLGPIGAALRHRYEMAAATGVAVERLIVGGRRVALRIAGEALAGAIAPAFAHLRDNLACDAGAPDLRVFAWDAAATGVDLPDEVPLGDDCSLHYDRASAVLTAVDRGGGAAWVCVRRLDGLPAWDLAHPLRRAIAAWARARGMIVAHAAVVGGPDGGIMVAGPGGSGKSTAALAWIADGGQAAGDDYVLIEPATPPVAHAIFATMRLHLDHAARFPGLLPAVDSIERQESGREKATINVAVARPGAMAPRVALLGMAVASIAPDGATRLAPLAGNRALLGLMPSSIGQFFDIADAGTLRIMADLCRTLPRRSLEIGGDPCGIARVLGGWLAELRSAAGMAR